MWNWKMILECEFPINEKVYEMKNLYNSVGLFEMEPLAIIYFQQEW